MNEKFKNIISEVEKLTVVELAELVKALEEKFGVSAASMAAPAAAAAGAGEEAEEKSSWKVVLKDAGGQKIQVIKVLREALGVGLQEAKVLTEGTPKPVKELDKAAADELKKKLEAAGAVVELQ